MKCKGLEELQNQRTEQVTKLYGTKALEAMQSEAALEDRIRAEIGSEADALKAENEKLRLAADPGMQAFQRYFENFRGAYADMKSLIATMGDEKQRKLVGVLRKTLAAMAEEWRE